MNCPTILSREGHGLEVMRRENQGEQEIEGKELLRWADGGINRGVSFN